MAQRDQNTSAIIDSDASSSQFELFIGRISTPLMYIFALVVVVSQFQAVVILGALLLAATFVYHRITMSQEKKLRDWANANPEQAKQESFEYKVRMAMEAMEKKNEIKK